MYRSGREPAHGPGPFRDPVRHIKSRKIVLGLATSTSLPAALFSSSPIPLLLILSHLPHAVYCAPSISFRYAFSAASSFFPWYYFASSFFLRSSPSPSRVLVRRYRRYVPVWTGSTNSRLPCCHFCISSFSVTYEHYGQVTGNLVAENFVVEIVIAWNNIGATPASGPP